MHEVYDKNSVLLVVSRLVPLQIITFFFFFNLIVRRVGECFLLEFRTYNL